MQKFSDSSTPCNKAEGERTEVQQIVRAKSEVLITFTSTDSDYYNLLGDHSGGVKTQVCRKSCSGYVFSRL